MSKIIKYLYLIPAGIVTFTILSVISSCSADDNPPGNTLPADKYPMTFTTSVGELVVTRGTADDSKWTGGEGVAIQLGNDAASYGEVKKYKAATDGSLTPADNADLLYWRSTTETVTAWYSATYSDTKPTSFTVQANQNKENNYQTSDFLYTTGTHTYSSNGACALVFKHLPTKVVINLKGDGNGITNDEIAAATVSIMNQSLTSGTINNDGTVEAAVAATAAITPKKLTTPTTDYQQTVQALLVPQVVRNMKFIEVTIGTGDNARHYYYTPTEVAFDSGKQYTYNITVKREGLEVTTKATGSWNNTADDNAAQEATFNIYLSKLTQPDNSTVAVTDNNNTLTANGGVYTTQSKTIKITYTLNSDYELQNFAPEVNAGICTPQINITNDTYTYTLTDIRSDIWLADITPTSLRKVKIGDYYYSDGTWSTELETNKTCIGIVFQTSEGGIQKGDQASDYGESISGKIRGYAVALKDAHSAQGGWGIRLIDETMTDYDISSPSKYDGYKNTKIIRNVGDKYTNTNADSPLADSQYWAFKVASDYKPIADDASFTAPTVSSGWYLPSFQQLVDINNSTVTGKFANVSGTDFKKGSATDHYWSSNEKNKYDAWYYIFYNSTGNTGAKSNNYDNDPSTGGQSDWLTKEDGSKSYVRAILTF